MTGDYSGEYAMNQALQSAPPTRPLAPRARVLFDGHCPFCRKSVALLRRLDWMHQLQYVDVRDPAALPAEAAGLAPERLLEEMHVLTPDGRQVYHGFAALRWLAWRLPLLWFMVPWLYVPGIPALGQRLYLWVARHRFQLVPCHGGVCTVHFPRR